MRYLAAFLLAQLGGQANPGVADLKKILSSVGIDSEDSRAQAVIESLKGKNIEELIEKGKVKLASVPSAAAVAAPAAGGAPAAKEAPKEEAKKKVEEKEESDDDMGFGLFD